MRQQMRALTAQWQRRGHALDFGVGIAQGYATLGMIGFEERVDHGTIGPVTNLAAGLCAEVLGGQILISQRVYVALEELLEAEPLGEFSLKGFLQPMPVFNMRALKEQGA
jgi:class 3 adenylate cyclase